MKRCESNYHMKEGNGAEEDKKWPSFCNKPCRIIWLWALNICVYIIQKLKKKKQRKLMT